MKKSTKNNSFKIPEGYFEELSAKLLDQIAQEDAVIPKNEGFKTPENYFEKLNASMLQKIDTTEETKVIQLKSYKKLYYAVAAIAAVFLLIFSYQFNTNDNYTFEDIASTEIEAYFDINDIGLTSYEIAEVFPINELDINALIDNQLIEENIIEYLENNMDDFEELNLEYDE